jgi:Tol biopolymer transport system component
VGINKVVFLNYREHQSDWEVNMNNKSRIPLMVIITLLLLLSLVTSSTTARSSLQVSSGTTVLVSVASDGEQANYGSEISSISANGRYVAFQSDATNLVVGDTNVKTDIFVHDLSTGETTRVSIASNGTQGNNTSQNPSISADGRYVAFESWADNLVPVDTNIVVDIFVHDLVTGETTIVSVASDGTQGDWYSKYPSISADGRYVAFQSAASNLVPGAGGNNDIFLRDRIAGETTIVSVTTDGTPADFYSENPSISADGRYIAFQSEASNLVVGDSNGLVDDIFVHEVSTGETTLVSVSSNGTQGNFQSIAPSISADGRYVSFESFADNLVSGDTNNATDVFLRDRLTGETTRVSVDSNGMQANDYSRNSSISADGLYVAFESPASNLVVGDTNGGWDIFLRDRMAGETTRSSIASNGAQGIGWSEKPSISADGRSVAFESIAENLVVGDTNEGMDIFVHIRGGIRVYLPLIWR